MLFLIEFEDYDGGEFVIDDIFGEYGVRFVVGDMVFYFSSSLYCVMFVICGVCVCLFFWL